MIKELVNLVAGQVNELVALLTLHVIAAAVLAVLCADIFVACR